MSKNPYDAYLNRHAELIGKARQEYDFWQGKADESLAKLRALELAKEFTETHRLKKGGSDDV